jgi:hypothetical protein
MALFTANSRSGRRKEQREKEEEEEEEEGKKEQARRFWLEDKSKHTTLVQRYLLVFQYLFS